MHLGTSTTKTEFRIKPFHSQPSSSPNTDHPVPAAAAAEEGYWQQEDYIDSSSVRCVARLPSTGFFHKPWGKAKSDDAVVAVFLVLLSPSVAAVAALFLAGAAAALLLSRSWISFDMRYVSCHSVATSRAAAALAPTPPLLVDRPLFVAPKAWLLLLLLSKCSFTLAICSITPRNWTAMLLFVCLFFQAAQLSRYELEQLYKRGGGTNGKN
jgi:hypothetical protein